MKTILAALFAVMIGVTFAGSTFAAEEKKMDAPAAAPATGGGEMKKDEGKKDEGKAGDKKGKKKKTKEEKEKEKGK